MRLRDINHETVRGAMETYLRIAWPGREEEKRPALPAGARGANLLAAFDDESKRDADRISRRYVKRLGNQRYPHMKLVIEEYLVPGEFFFAVDTHDHVDLKPGFPDYEAWQELKRHNRSLKDEIERHWRSRGIHTYATLKAMIGEAERPPPGHHTASGRILIVDDERDIADAVASILIAEGYDVLLAHDGEEAVATALREQPDLVLMDYDMPRLDGVEAAIRVRRALSRKTCRILLATASLVDLSTVQEADGFLLKPYSRDILLSFIGALMR